MKTQLIQLSAIAVLLYVFCALLLLSCNVLSGEKGYDLSSSYTLRAGERAKVWYEAETVSVMRPEGEIPEVLKEQYVLRSIPVVSRSRVEVSINRAGEARWVIEDLEPERIFPDGRQGIPPDLSPRVTKTIIEGNHAVFYDREGKAIRSGRIDMPDLARVNFFLESAGHPLEEKVTRAREHGSEVLTQPNGNLTLKTRKSLPGFYSAEGSHPDAGAGNVEIVELVDTKSNRIVASALYDASGNMLEDTRLQYRDDSGQLAHIHSESITTDPNRVKVKSITDTYFAYVHVIVSDN